MEVNLKQCSEEERRKFAAAKQAEVSKWIEFSAVRAALTEVPASR